MPSKSSPDAPLAPLPDALAVQLTFNHGALRQNLQGLTHDETLWTPAPDPGDGAAGSGPNGINWIVGHILVHRSKILELLGAEALWSEAEGAAYARGSGPLAPEAAHSLLKLLEDLDTAHRRTREALAAVSAEHLAADAPFTFRRQGRETIGSLVAGLTFHEAYHVGQTGVLRRLLGKAGAIG